MMFSGDWRPGVWPAVQVHSLVLGDGGRRGEGRETAALCGRWSGLTLVAVLACLEKGKWASGGDEMRRFLSGVSWPLHSWPFLRDSLRVAVGPGVWWHHEFN